MFRKRIDMRIFLSILFLFLSNAFVAQTDVLGCNVEIACNYDPEVTINDGTCDFVSCLVLGCTDSAACNYNDAATVNDGSCDYLSCLAQGCTLADACNFDVMAEVNDGSCEFTSCAGCTNEFADNFDETATIDDGSCNPIEGCTNPQACNFDVNANSDDSSCDFVSCLATGCTDATACNYDVEAQVNDGTCSYPVAGRDCEGNCLEDADGDDVCDGDEIPGCTSETALNYSDVATDDDGSCIEPVAGCTDPEACNFDMLATNENGTCEFTSCAGCLQESACNYDASALYADESCEFPAFGYDCDGECLLDADEDGVCDPFEIVGCQDDSACNFDPSATDPGNCSFAAANFDCEGNSLKPIFTSFPSDVTLQAWQVPLAGEAVVEAIVSPFAPSFEATFNANECYDTQSSPVVVFAGETRIDGVCEHDYTLFRSWTASDCSGYSRTRQQIIIVVDTVSPELFVPSDLIILCEDVDSADLGEAFGQDDCGEVSIEISTEIVPGACEGNYTIVRSFLATDPCLNETTGEQSIQVMDNEAPIITALSDLTLGCDDVVPSDLPEAFDNCSNVTIVVEETEVAGDCPQERTVERLFTATDACGNSSTSLQKVTFVDDEAPTIEAGFAGCETPADCAIEINALLGETLPEADLTLVDNCDDAPVWSYSDEVLFNSNAAQTILRTYSITDACGNELEVSELYSLTLVYEGCSDDAACNYDAEVNVLDDSCEYCSCGTNACGCLDVQACNFDADASYDDGSCEFADPGFNCDGVCDDVNENGVCDIEEAGCTDSQACNYDEVAAVDDGSCDYCCGYDTFTSSEAGYGVDIELVQTHAEGSLAGLSTYRVYVTMTSSEDVLTAVTGSDEFPLELATTTTFYQNVFGGCLGSNISPAMMVVAPDAAYDSWVTIGATSSDDVSEGETQLIPGVWIEEFESGSSIVVNDGLGSGWFIIPPGGLNGVAGDDNRVLVAQLTTDGQISGSFRTQIFPEGDQVNDIRPDLTFAQAPLGAFACPIIEAGPADEVVSCEDDIEMPTGSDFLVSYASATAEALGCSDDLVVELVEDNVSEGDCPGNYSIERTLTVTNCAGGSASYVYSIQVQDIVAPEFLSVPSDYTSECSDELILDDASASDNCGEVTIEVSSETIAGAAAGNYAVVRTFVATDLCGNSSEAQQTITVEDTTAPEFTSVPADYTSECSDALILDDATASDNCGEVTIEVSSETIAGDAAGNYTVVRTFTATDDAGNSTSATQTITVQDTTAPEFTSVPADYTSECSDALILDDATASDNCGEVTIEVSSETIAGDAAGNYTVVRTFTATDDAGNSTFATQTITVEDTTAPEFTSVPADYTSECSDDLILDDATASDNCGEVTIEVSSETIAGNCAHEYQLIRTFTATDDAGNSAEATQIISVVDTTGPDLFVPPSYEADCGDELLLLDALASDACGLALVTLEESYDYSCAQGYVLTRTFTALDECFNETIGVQTITVSDSEAPVFTFVPEGYSAECSDELVLDDASAMDNCGEAAITVVNDTIAGDCANAFTLIRTFTADDGCGNTTSATQTIEVSDTTAPEFTFVPEDQLIECNVSLDGTMATATDQCGEVTVEVEEVYEQGACGGAYVITRTFTAVDACGNSNSAVQTITQQDTTSPLLDIASDVTIECDEPAPAAEYTASDACGAVTVEVLEEIVPGSCPQSMTIVRTYIATDDCGNATSATQTIEVVDTTAPAFTYTPESTSIVFEAEGDTLAAPFVVVIDNCDTEASWSVEETILVDLPNELTVERVYTAFDACGNQTSFTEVATLVLQVLGCTDSEACNYDSFANEDDDSCFYPLYGYDCDGNCLNDDNDNGICDELEVSGCTDPDNPGYNPEANVDDGSCLTGGCTIEFACNFDVSAEFQIAGACEFDSCAGCTSEEACNYDSEATLNDGSCEFPAYGYGCDGECLNDEDGDGICDEFEIAGCTDPSNPAYNPAATDDDGSCLVAGCLLPFACNFEPTADYLDIALCDLNSCSGCTDPEACTFDPSATLSAPADCIYPASQFVDCEGVCNNDADGDGICDELEIPGCTDPAASNYSPFATDDNGTCIIEVGGCTLPFACNFDPSADFYLPGACDFSCLFGMPFDGEACSDDLACNFGLDEPCMYFDANGSLCAQVGCMNEAACNFDADAQVNSGCEYASCQVFGCTNANACNFELSATTEDGSCEYATCLGCMDSEASNFDPDATLDNGQCQFDVMGCTLLIACNYNPTATVNDGSCDFTGCFGCVTPSACNYDDNALYPDGSCEFASNGQDCNGNCLVDSDGDSVCDANEVVGCTDPEALNFNANATDESGTCQYASTGCTNQTACNFDFTAQEDDGTCDFESCTGCIVSWACNYDEGATLNDGSCVFPDASGVCPSVCEFDADGDGICDANEVSGCTYFNASNFSPLATDDNGNCVFEGCISPDFTSYNALANTSNGQCTNTPVSADFTGDGVVQLEDLLDFLVAYGTSGPEWGLEWIQDGCSVAAMGIADMDVNPTGCTYPTAANYDPTAAFDLGTCVWLGCTDSEALNFNALATLDDSSCSYNVCPDFNGDGQVQAQDLLDFLIAWGTVYD